MRDELLKKEIVRKIILKRRDTKMKEAITKRIDDYVLSRAKKIVEVAEILKDVGKKE